MKKILSILLISLISLFGLVAVTEPAKADTNPNKVVGTFKIGASAVTASQKKIINSLLKKSIYYENVSCEAFLKSPDSLTRSQSKKIESLLKKSCEIFGKNNKHIDVESDFFVNDETVPSGKFILKVFLSDPRRVDFYDRGVESGTLPASSKLFKWGEKFTVPGNTGNAANYELPFLGWSKNSNSEGRIYEPGDKIVVKEGFTLVPRWDGYEVTITTGSLGVGVERIGINYIDVSNNSYTTEYVGPNSSITIVNGSFDRHSPITIAAPINSDQSSMTFTDIVIPNASYYYGTCGWTLEGVDQCSWWDIEVDEDGTAAHFDFVLDESEQ